MPYSPLNTRVFRQRGCEISCLRIRRLGVRIPSGAQGFFPYVSWRVPQICPSRRAVTEITPFPDLNHCHRTADEHVPPMNEQKNLLDAGDLAVRWGVTRATALSYTRRRAFPPPIGLSSKTLRWRMEQIAQWEESCQTQPVRRTTRKRAVAAPHVRPIIRKVGA